MIQTADANGDGVISQDEFVAAYGSLEWVRAQVRHQLVSELVSVLMLWVRACLA